MLKKIRIGTRKSPLALWQAYYVRDAISRFHPDIQVDLVEIVSAGDKHLETPLAKIGGKGLFLKELETALLEDEVDIAVHSMKDVTVHLPVGLHIPVICEREDPRDAFVSNQYSALSELPDGAKVGTCSLRRKSQIAAKYPRLQLLDLRGNVNTRLARLDNGDFDAIILAAAGLLRLEFGARIAAFIDPEEMLPAVGQGAVGIECREGDIEVENIIAPLHHEPTAIRVRAERAANEKLGGGCHVPVAAHAILSGDEINFRALVASVDGETVLQCEYTAPLDQAQQLGERAAQTLIEQGADGILKGVYRELGG
jgi:hydroxymethylbilane synthase